MRAAGLIQLSQYLGATAASAWIVTLGRIFPKILPTIACFYLLLLCVAILACLWRQDPEPVKSQMDWSAGVQRQTLPQKPKHYLSPSTRFSIVLSVLSALIGVLLAGVL